jgi:CBS domain-containing protein
MRVHEVMTANVLSVGPSTPVPDVSALMQRRKIRHVLVMDGPRLQGIVSDRDVRLNAPSPATSLSVWEIRGLLLRLTAGDIMASALVTIGPDGEIEEAARLMVDHRIGALPVVEGGRVVGIVTETDLLRALIVLRDRGTPAPT